MNSRVARTRRPYGTATPYSACLPRTATSTPSCGSDGTGPVTDATGPVRATSAELLEGDLRPLGLQLLLGLVRGLLVDLLQDRLRGPLHQVLGLLQTQAGQLPHHLDDLDLLAAVALQDDVELVLLRLGLGRGRGRTRRRRHRRNRRRGGHVEGLLELLHELEELEQRHLLESFEQLLGAQLRHGRRPLPRSFLLVGLLFALVPERGRRPGGLGQWRLE